MYWTIRDQADKNARDIRHQEALGDDHAAKAHASQVEVDVKTTRARRLRQHASAAATNREPAGVRLWHAAADHYHAATWGQRLLADRHQLVDRVLGTVDSWESEHGAL